MTKLFDAFGVKSTDELAGNLLLGGLIFIKKCTKFGKTSGAIFLPKRLIGKQYRVALIPVEDPMDMYEESNLGKGKGQQDKEVKKAEKLLNSIQNEK